MKKEAVLLIRYLFWKTYIKTQTVKNYFQINEGATFSWSTRIKGFLVCFIIGILLSFLGSFALFFHKGLSVFAVFYTLGNVVSIASTCFLMGPFNQFKKMFASTRIIATIIVIVSFGMTLFAALYVSNHIFMIYLQNNVNAKYDEKLFLEYTKLQHTFCLWCLPMYS